MPGFTPGAWFIWQMPNSGAGSSGACPVCIPVPCPVILLPTQAGGSDSSFSGGQEETWGFQHPFFQARKVWFPRDRIEYIQLFHFGDNCIATSMAAEKRKDCKIAIKKVARLRLNGFDQQLLLLLDVSVKSFLFRSLPKFADMRLPYGTKQQSTSTWQRAFTDHICELNVIKIKQTISKKKKTGDTNSFVLPQDCLPLEYRQSRSTKSFCL